MPSPNKTEIKIIDWTLHLDPTQFANPRHEVHFTDGTEAITSSDASDAYGLDGAEYRGIPLAITFTPAGRILYVNKNPCPGSGQEWASGEYLGGPVCPECHRAPHGLAGWAGYDGKPPVRRKGHWTGHVPAHPRLAS